MGFKFSSFGLGLLVSPRAQIEDGASDERSFGARR